MIAQSSLSRSHLHLVSPPNGADEHAWRTPRAASGRPVRVTWPPLDHGYALTVTHQDRASLWIMALAGEADISTRDELVRGLDEAVSEEREVLIVDVSELEFCDSRCAVEVIEANLNAPETQMILVGGHGMVSRVFDLLDPAGTLPRHPGRKARPSTFGGLEGRGAHDLPPVRRT
jgi:anti-anti-sigma factor